MQISQPILTHATLYLPPFGCEKFDKTDQNIFLIFEMLYYLSKYYFFNSHFVFFSTLVLFHANKNIKFISRITLIFGNDSNLRSPNLQLGFTVHELMLGLWRQHHFQEWRQIVWVGAGLGNSSCWKKHVTVQGTLHLLTTFLTETQFI